MIATLTLNPTIDQSAEVPRVIPERKLRLTEPTREPGGGGINVARAIRHLGGEALAIWTSGGHTGALLGDLIQAEDVPSRPVPVKGLTRTSWIVREQETGLQYRFGTPGPNLSPAEVEAVLEAIRSLDPAPDFFVASGSLPPGVPPDFYARIATTLPARTKLVLDTSGEALRLALGARLFLIKPNLRELGDITGAKLEDEASIQQAAMSLVKKSHSEVIVVSLGAGGAMLASAAGCHRINSPTVPIRSKVGAGDSMVAGTVLALSRGLSLRDAVRFGVAAGAAAVMTPGTGLCHQDDTERLYAQMDLASARPP